MNRIYKSGEITCNNSIFMNSDIGVGDMDP